MRISRLYVLLGALALSVALLAYALAPAPQATEEQLPVEVPSRTEEPASETSIVRTESESMPLERVVDTVATATLVVDGVRYPLTAPAGATLKEAMDTLAIESDFTYRYRTYAGLGAFVTHIQNRASDGDMVWILYVDGEKSNTGISSTRIRSGNVIEWKLEKSY